MVTDWQEFKTLDYGALASKMNTPNLIDGRNFLDRNVLEQAGFNYIGIGRAASTTQSNILESKLVTAP